MSAYNGAKPEPQRADGKRRSGASKGECSAMPIVVGGVVISNDVSPPDTGDPAGALAGSLPPGPPVGEPAPGDPLSALLAWLAGEAALASAEGQASARQSQDLRDAASALARSGDPIRLAARAGSLDARVAWFQRWLALLPEADSARWLARRWAQSPRVAPVTLQASDAEERLERLLQDASLPAERRQLAQAVWLAATAPAPICFDPQQRSRNAALRDASLQRWLEQCSLLG